MGPQFLSVEEVIALHAAQIARFGGSGGIRDIGLLESAVATPQVGVGDDYLHRDLFEMAGAYLFHIVMNHPFIDGNKRTALHAALTFLADNGYRADLSADAAYNLVIAVCEGAVTKRQLADMFREHAMPLAP